MRERVRELEVLETNEGCVLDETCTEFDRILNTRDIGNVARLGPDVEQAGGYV